MTDPISLQIAIARADRTSEPARFISAYRLARKGGADSYQYLRDLIAAGDTAAAAGLIEGLASERFHPVGCDCGRCHAFWEQWAPAGERVAA